MIKLLLNIGSAFKNRHVSIPAVLAVGCEWGKVKWPQYAHPFGYTQHVLGGYGLVAAANTGPAQMVPVPKPSDVPATGSAKAGE